MSADGNGRNCGKRKTGGPYGSAFLFSLPVVVIYFPHSGDLTSKLEAAEAKYGEQAARTTQFKTIAWYQLSDAKKKVKALSIASGQVAQDRHQQTQKVDR